MIGRRAIAGLTLLCALIFLAASAQSAFALQGTTAATCVAKAGAGEYSDAHCTTGKANGGFEAPEVTENAETFFEGSNSSTKAGTIGAVPAVLKATVEGVATEVECSTSASTGGFKNKKGGEGQMFAESQAPIKLTTITYTGCVVQQPKAAGEECTVNSPGKAAGTIVTNQLSGITAVEKVGAAEEMYVLVQGAGGVFAELVFTAVAGKTCPAALTKKALQVTGEAKLEANGATLISPHPKIASSLKLGGFAASLTSSETMRMDREGGATQNPLFLKTTQT